MQDIKSFASFNEYSGKIRNSMGFEITQALDNKLNPPFEGGSSGRLII